MLLIRCFVLFCETIYRVFECMAFFHLVVHGKIVFPELCLNIVFLLICNSYEFQKIFSSFVALSCLLK